MNPAQLLRDAIQALDAIGLPVSGQPQPLRSRRLRPQQQPQQHHGHVYLAESRSHPHGPTTPLVIKLFRERLDGANPFGLDRQREARIATLAAEHGLAPHVVLWPQDAAFAVCSRIGWPHPQAGTAAAPPLRQHIARCLASVHDLAADALPAMDYGEQARRYLAALGGPDELLHRLAQATDRTIARRFGTRLDELLTRADLLTQAIDEPVLCHHDPMLHNLLWDEHGEQLLLLDWEYAAYGHPAFDISAFVIGNDLDTSGNPDQATAHRFTADFTTDFIAEYEQVGGRRIDPHTRQLAATTYRLLELLWTLADDLDSSDNDWLEARLQRLLDTG